MTDKRKILHKKFSLIYKDSQIGRIISQDNAVNISLEILLNVFLEEIPTDLTPEKVARRHSF